MTELIAVVAALDRGAVILPGLDRRCDAAQWAAIEADEAHPAASDGDPAEGARPRARPISAIGPMLSARHGTAPAHRRLRLVGEAMRPAATTDAWRDLAPLPAEALAGLSRYDCAGAHEEALTIALLLRRKLETPGATAALVTPDRELARRVAAELRRWGIEIDNSAGLPLNRTPPGVFLRLVLDLAASGLAPVPLLAALKHPLAAGGLAPAAFRDLTRPLEAGDPADRARRPASPVSEPRSPAPTRKARAALPTGSKPASARCRICSPPDRRRSPASRPRISRRPSGWRRPMPRPAARGCGAKRPAKRRPASATS